ncbi:hypothetical protein VCO01S_05450 [Vibrio comitans NBRC 102076]|uniref:Uncharacterized protein n=1 Tax=Vibrio comitans NBRC 102076 TaxID=1219078 RepID=A0A4Y3IK13_9VIBR|nr:hypothetical protein VCO01S_05450 [Vibrio comitans NBRC 102076]
MINFEGSGKKAVKGSYIKSSDKPVDALQLANEIILELKRDNSRYVREIASIKKENAHLHRQISQSLSPLR